MQFTTICDPYFLVIFINKLSWHCRQQFGSRIKYISSTFWGSVYTQYLTKQGSKVFSFVLLKDLLVILPNNKNDEFIQDAWN